VMRFANATMDGLATSRDDALVINEAGLLFPLLVPLTPFNEVPDLRPGMETE
jgi:hypothetical protein